MQLAGLESGTYMAACGRHPENSKARVLKTRRYTSLQTDARGLADEVAEEEDYVGGALC
jgi:hypothetical protein